MLGSPFCIERCSLTVRNKRKARQDGFRPFVPRVLGGKKLGRIRPRGHALAKPSGFPAENNHGRLGVCVSISLSRKRGARNPTAIFSIVGLGAHVRSSKEGCDIFSRMRSLSRVCGCIFLPRASARFSAFESGSLVSSFLCGNYGSPGKHGRGGGRATLPNTHLIH